VAFLEGESSGIGEDEVARAKGLRIVGSFDTDGVRADTERIGVGNFFA